MRKKRVLIHSSYSKSKSGFGRHVKELLKHLQKTGKYEIAEIANGTGFSHESHDLMPWKTFGTMPNSEQEHEAYISSFPEMEREAKKKEVYYGSWAIDKIIKEFRPDVYLGVEDVWAFRGFTERKWWNKLSCGIHTTLDSLPILPDALEIAPKIEDYFVWAEFAERAMREAGHSHVKTVHGIVDGNFKKFNELKRQELREANGIPKDAFVIGFVFRNQLRKSVVPLLEAFKQFLNVDPKAYLLLHTGWHEGWNIAERIREFNVPPERVLTTYICAKCGAYEVKPYQLSEQEWKERKINVAKGQKKPCKYCKTSDSQVTTSVGLGVSEAQLAEIYNLMDVYCHPFTSGGQEMPVQEAKLSELITLVTDYSCGTEYSLEKNGGLPLSWEAYREPGTEFIKAATKVESILFQLKKVRNFSKEKRDEWGKRARNFVLDGFSSERIGGFFEKWIDSKPFSEWNFSFEEKDKNPNYPMPQISDDKEFLRDIYSNILDMNPKDDDSGLNYWIREIQNGKTREEIYAFFVETAFRENQKNKKIDFTDLFDKKSQNKRLLLVVKESLGDCILILGLLDSIKSSYQNYDIYLATQPKYFEIFYGNQNVHGLIPFHPAMESELFMIGQGSYKGYVDIYMYPCVSTQKFLNYLSNENFEIKCT